MPKKRELRSSSILGYIKCGERYRRAYIEQERCEPGLTSARGTAIHKGASHNFSQKIKSRKDVKAKEIIEVAVEQLHNTVRNEGLYLSPDEKSIGRPILLNQTEQTVMVLSDLYAHRVAPKYQPLSVEIERKVEIPETDLVLVTHPDLETRDQKIVDIKSHAKSPKDSEADESMQLTFYAMSFEASHGNAASAIVLEHLVRTQTMLKAVEQRTVRDRSDYIAAIQMIRSVGSAIEKEVFPPAYGQAGAWWCSAKWCPFHSSCKFVPERIRGKV